MTTPEIIALIITVIIFCFAASIFMGKFIKAGRGGDDDTAATHYEGRM